MNLRTHRKVIVIDGRVGFTGGINVTDDENEQVRKQAYRDSHVRLQGHVVRSLQLVFLEDWLYATGQGRAAFHGQQLWPDVCPPARKARWMRKCWCPARIRRGKRSTA